MRNIILVTLISIVLLVSCAPAPTAAPAPATSAPATAAQAKTALVVPLGWLLNDEFTPLVAAQKQGFFSAGGLDVTLISGGGSTGFDPIKAINGMDSKITFGVPADISAVINAHAQGLDVVAIAAFTPIAPAAFFALTANGNHAKSPCDFKGKVVAMQADSLWIPEVLGGRCPASQGGPLKSGVDFTVIPAGFTPDCLFSNQCDFYSGWVTNQAFILKQKGLVEGKDYEYFMYSDFMPIYYGDVVVTTSQNIKNHPDRVKAFVQAVANGLKYVYENPANGIQIADTIEGVDPLHAAWRIPAQNKITMTDDTKAHGFGWIDIDKVQQEIQFLYDNKQITKMFDAHEIVDMSFYSEINK